MEKIVIEFGELENVMQLRQDVLGWSQTTLDAETRTNVRHFVAKNEQGDTVGCGSCALVAFPDGDGASYGPVRSMRFWGVAVDEAYRMVGIGKRIMEAVKVRAAEQDVHILWGNARIDAISFYEKLNYHAVGTIKESLLSGVPSQKVVFDLLLSELDGG
jgi:ribosomal protein S18 acetylase RimI-like enzyme